MIFRTKSDKKLVLYRPINSKSYLKFVSEQLTYFGRLNRI